jgi:hypothetical protein
MLLLSVLSTGFIYLIGRDTNYKADRLAKRVDSLKVQIGAIGELDSSIKDLSRRVNHLDSADSGWVIYDSSMRFFIPPQTR